MTNIAKNNPENDMQSPRIDDTLKGNVEKLVNIFSHKLISFLIVYPDFPYSLLSCLTELDRLSMEMVNHI